MGEAEDAAVPGWQDQPEAVRRFDARRCRVCGGVPAPFGFCLPLTKAEHGIWACEEHRGRLDAMLSGG